MCDNNNNSDIGNKDCEECQKELKDHLTKCADYGVRPALICKCEDLPGGCGNPAPECCPAPPPKPCCPPPKPKCDTPTTTFQCPESSCPQKADACPPKDCGMKPPDCSTKGQSSGCEKKC